jgi:hypothetical protein
MDEDFEMDDPSAGGYLQALGETNPALAAFASKYEDDMASEAAARQRQAATQKEMYEAGRAEILARRYGAPTTQDQLFALGSALLAPRRYRGFAGTMDKINPALGQLAQLKSGAEGQRSEALDKLQREYLMGGADAGVEAATAQREARGKALSPIASATRPRVPRIVGTETIEGVPHQGEQDPVTGEVRWTPINPEAQAPQLTAPQRNALAQLQNYISNPNVPAEQKQSALRVFQSKFKVNPLDYLKGAM